MFAVHLWIFKSIKNWLLDTFYRWLAHSESGHFVTVWRKSFNQVTKCLFVTRAAAVKVESYDLKFPIAFATFSWNIFSVLRPHDRRICSLIHLHNTSQHLHARPLSLNFHICNLITHFIQHNYDSFWHFSWLRERRGSMKLT